MRQGAQAADTGISKPIFHSKRSAILLKVREKAKTDQRFGRDLFIEEIGGELNLLDADSAGSHRFAMTILEFKTYRNALKKLLWTLSS